MLMLANLRLFLENDSFSVLFYWSERFRDFNFLSFLPFSDVDYMVINVWRINVWVEGASHFHIIPVLPTPCAAVPFTALKLNVPVKTLDTEGIDVNVSVGLYFEEHGVLIN